MYLEHNVKRKTAQILMFLNLAAFFAIAFACTFVWLTMFTDYYDDEVLDYEKRDVQMRVNTRFVNIIPTTDLLLELTKRLSNNIEDFKKPTSIKQALIEALKSVPASGDASRTEHLRSLAYVLNAYTDSIHNEETMKLGSSAISTDEILLLVSHRLNIKDYQDASNYTSWVSIANSLRSNIAKGNKVNLLTSGCLELLLISISKKSSGT